ncbi:SUMF1/EgtB/PvdO family nonheme iron enzyme [Waterburya agarophytonicola K14]|uniref:SUMF1/EgtB/PvdO family nonheme iron enzyme n=1 Tax=Waterburya agarophytonicola KI4 TaxID=2874699 RepID=A0A964BVH9_9CYAN|nr:SAV_2336 N-terminal domain-related protein [Waterburya agarophytonicola]MCC0179829.1 SUMF1/EgtB/PvdO family nonheme iron enzyme [Waterburya agarophytonicola KI4]
MSDDYSLAKPDRFGKLLETLNQSELAMDSYELADMCWLLLNAPQIEESAENQTADNSTQQPKNINKPGKKKSGNNQTSTKPSITSQNDSGSGNNQENLEDNKKQKKPQGELYPPQPQGKTVGDVLTFPVDNPTDLGRSLGLARALRALLKRVPAQSRPEILDEIETAESYAATNKAVLAPVFKPVLEPWLEIALVVDGHASLNIWHQTIKDLILFLGNYGIFRDVRVWKLVEQDNKLRLYKGLEVDCGIISTPKELLNPNGRRIIIVLSDCVADYWHNGKIYSLLQQWQQTSPLAILQMLPEWLWLKTGLTEGAKVTFFSSEPGVKNRQLLVKDILLWEDVFNNPNLKIPVFTLEAKSVEQWSHVVAGRSDRKVAGFILPSKPSSDGQSLRRSPKDLDANAIVRRFRNNSSPLAQELAELLAATPTIFLPVVRLIRSEILPEAGQTQIAEVFLSGILQVSQDYPQSQDPDLVLYDFISPEVRNVLQTSSTKSLSLKVFERVSRYIAERIGIELRDFLAELKKPLEEINPEYGNIIYPFAKVSKEILLNLGGDYARFAREELKAAKYNIGNFPPLQDLEYESAKIVLLQGIELQTEEFEVAEVVIEPEIYEIFEFVTAKLERKPKGLLQRINLLSRNDEEWEIKKQTKQEKQLVEKLSDAVDLEMVLILPGKFMMGDSKNQHQVNIRYSFLMGKYPVTQEQWQAIMGNNPSTHLPHVRMQHEVIQDN